MKLFHWLVVLALIAAVAHALGTRGSASGSASDALARYDPCREPLTWRVGEIDERFGIRREAVAEAVHAAVGVWEEPTGLELFRYDPAGEMPVHFTWDHRQADFLADEERRGELRSLEAAIRREQAVYDAAQEEYERAAEAGRRFAEGVNARVNAYNAVVAAWNREGGAPEEELVKLREEEAGIQRDQAEARARAAALEDHRQRVAADARRLEQAAARYNARAAELREESPGRLINSATFQIESTERTGRRPQVRRWITVFQFQSEEHLVFLLAHELGHALDLGHVPDETAIMREEHAMDQLVGEVRAHPADIAALRERCGG